MGVGNAVHRGGDVSHLQNPDVFRYMEENDKASKGGMRELTRFKQKDVDIVSPGQVELANKLGVNLGEKSASELRRELADAKIRENRKEFEERKDFLNKRGLKDGVMILKEPFKRLSKRGDYWIYKGVNDRGTLILLEKDGLTPGDYKLSIFAEALKTMVFKESKKK